MKSTANNILNGKKSLEAISLKSGLSAIPTPSQHCVGSTSWSSETREGNLKGYRWEEVKKILGGGQHITH